MRRLLPDTAACLALCVLMTGCREETEAPDAPGVKVYRTYDMVTVMAKQCPQGGFVLLCKRYPNDQRTSHVQFLDDEGGLRERLELDLLPDSIAGTFVEPDQVRYTDVFAETQDTLLLAGICRRIDTTYVVAIRLSRSGHVLNSMIEQLTLAPVVDVIGDDSLAVDINGLPRERALIDRSETGGIYIAARWETDAEASISLMRRGKRLEAPPQSPGSSVALDIPTYRLHVVGLDPSTGKFGVVYDANDALGASRSVELKKVDFDFGGGSVVNLDVAHARPCAMVSGPSALLITGYMETGDRAGYKPFVRDEGGLHVLGLEGVVDPESPVSSYCAAWWNGRLHMVVHAQEASLPPPYFADDVSSDMLVVELGPELSVVGSHMVIPGQGLRAVGIFDSQGHEIIIGSQHPFLNPNYEHTFFIEAE